MEGKIPHVVSGDGGAMDGQDGGAVWQQQRAAAHLRPGFQQEHVLPPAAAAGTEMGILRQSAAGREKAGVEGDVGTAAHQSGRVQPDITEAAGGFSEECGAAAGGEDEAPVGNRHRGTAAPGIVHRHEQHAECAERPVGEPPLHLRGFQPAHRRGDANRLHPALCPGTERDREWTPLVFRQTGDGAADDEQRQVSAHDGGGGFLQRVFPHRQGERQG